MQISKPEVKTVADTAERRLLPRLREPRRQHDAGHLMRDVQAARADGA
jgi:hypothetical protein